MNTMNAAYMNNGNFQQEYERLYKDYVENMDNQGTFMGAAFRMANKILVEYFEAHNADKAIRMRSRWEDAIGGYSIKGYEMSANFEYYLDYLKRDFFQHFDNSNGMALVDDVEKIIKRAVYYANSDINMRPEDNPRITKPNSDDAQVYIRLMDEVINTMINNIQHDIDFDLHWNR